MAVVEEKPEEGETSEAMKAFEAEIASWDPEERKSMEDWVIANGYDKKNIMDIVITPGLRVVPSRITEEKEMERQRERSRRSKIKRLYRWIFRRPPP